MKKKLIKALLFCLTLSPASIILAQVGIGTTTPDASAALDVVSTDKGFLPPRLTTAQRDAIPDKTPGLTIFNTDTNCLQWFQGPNWFGACNGALAPIGGDFNNGFEDNNTCKTKSVSLTSCAEVPGAILNDDNTTAEGIEYDWPDGNGMIDGSTTQNLVEIGGQCWYRRNAVNTPSAYTPSPAYATDDVGWSGVYSGGPYTNEGLLYQWSAAMNGSTTERAQGVCPAGWHVPSDCEWMYLENTLGMTVADQELTGTRSNLSYKLSTLTPSANNASGFTALMAGNRFTSGFLARGSFTAWWTSTEDGTSAYRRVINSNFEWIGRTSNQPKASALSIRCLKD